MAGLIFIFLTALASELCDKSGAPATVLVEAGGVTSECFGDSVGGALAGIESGRGAGGAERVEFGGGIADGNPARAMRLGQGGESGKSNMHGRCGWVVCELAMKLGRAEKVVPSGRHVWTEFSGGGGAVRRAEVPPAAVGWFDPQQAFFVVCREVSASLLRWDKWS